MAMFTLEIGFEEIPARFMAGLESELTQRLNAALTERDLGHSALRVFITPRRAAVLVDDLPAVQPLREQEVTGPPARVAFGTDGAPTKAAVGFAKTQGVDVADLYRVSTDKGDYVAALTRTGGQATAEVLAELCPALIQSLPFPKRMRWGSGDLLFARPLRWILALLDDQVVPFTVGTVTSGCTTLGHRVHSGLKPLPVAHAGQYLAVITEQGKIMVDPAARRAHIVEQGNALASALNNGAARIVWKDSLIDEVQGLAEHPVPLLGNIDPAYLELPRQVLLTSMETHQKSFGVEGPDGQLAPHFLTVLNLTPPDATLVRHGWERVLRARLEDARFFWQSDLASEFSAWQKSLDSVTFLAPLGSMGDKTRRLAGLCRWLASAVHSTVSADDAVRAGELSKADLVSGMVGEFDTLQGIMGSIYARRKGESEAVSAALAEQYLPAGPDSPVPATELGALLSMADKADTLAGCFGLGMIPTGTADPYALRRCALGIARIMLEKGYRFDVHALFALALEQYGQRAWKFSTTETLTRLGEFFAARVKYMLLGQGGDTLLVEAVTAAGAADVWATARRLEAMTTMSHSVDFDEAVQTFKRVANILRKQAEGAVALDGVWSDALLVEAPEKALAAEVTAFQLRFAELEGADRYDELFALLGALRPVVDAFFEGVMVMSDDADKRTNRLNLLAALLGPLSRLADFSALQK